ncbi:transposase [Cohnella laeviribosi]
MSYAGLVPSENSTGLTTRRGSLTKAGNTHFATGPDRGRMELPP